MTSQPEISQRCASCGAALREPGMFCPECGKPIAVAAEPAQHPEPEPGEHESGSMETVSQVSATEQPDPDAVEVEIAAVQAETHLDSKPPSELKDDDGEAESKRGGRGRAREKLHRAGSAASNVARHALDDNVKRVEKIHHVSTAMFEEATYDPSLRFVLVALGLFVIAVILLILSKVMG